MLNRMTRTIPTLLVLMALAIPSVAEARKPAGMLGRVKRVQPQGMPKNFWLPAVNIKGREYLRTYRVTSKEGLKRISSPKNSFRWFQGDGQYGEAFYLFRSAKSARAFAKCEKSRGAGHRNVIAEVWLPRDKFEQVAKKKVTKEMDWGMQRGRNDPGYSALRDARNGNHILFGKWAPTPFTSEPFYDRMNGAKQIGVVQRGMPSILNEAIIVPLKARK